MKIFLRYIDRCYLLLGFIVSFYSCEKAKIENEGSLIVEVVLAIEEDDVLELFYNSTENENFSSNSSLRKFISGNNSEQRIEFVLNKGIYPSRIRLDLGENKNQKDIILIDIVLKFNNGTHAFSDDELKKYFRPNKYLVFNFENKIASPRTIKNKYDPHLISYNISKFINKLILY